MGDHQEKVRNYLRRGGLRVGDRLPGERAMAATLGLGRAALRSVLDTLEVEGVLTRRPQSGTFLAAIPLPAGRGASVTVIAPFGGTGQVERATAEPSFLHRVISAFERTATPAGIRLTLVDQSPMAGDPCSVIDLVREAAANQARATILLHPLGTRAKINHALAILHDLGVHPIIVSSRTYPGIASQVYFDSGWGAYLATRHLLMNGHRRIAFAGGPQGHEWIQERLSGYRGALEAGDVVADSRLAWLSDEGERWVSPADGVNALRFWLSLPPEEQPTSVVAANDLIATGILEAAKEAGLAVPGELSVVGFDNDPGTLLTGLTTVERPTEALGETIARVTLERLAEGSGAETVTVRLRPVLIERRTVGPPRS